jgi:hypothetical protein
LTLTLEAVYNDDMKTKKVKFGLEAVVTYKRRGPVRGKNDLDPYVELSSRFLLRAEALAWLRAQVTRLLKRQAEYVLDATVYDPWMEPVDYLTSWEIQGLKSPPKPKGGRWGRASLKTRKAVSR